MNSDFYTKIQNELIDLPLKAYDKLVLIFIQRWAFDSTKSLANKFIANGLGISIGQANKSLKSLLEKNIIKVTACKSTGRSYVINDSKFWQVSGEVVISGEPLIKAEQKQEQVKAPVSNPADIAEKPITKDTPNLASFAFTGEDDESVLEIKKHASKIELQPSTSSKVIYSADYSYLEERKAKEEQAKLEEKAAKEKHEKFRQKLDAGLNKSKTESQAAA